MGNILQYIWMTILFLLLLGLLFWAVCYIEDVENKISVFAIVAVILAAFTSVLTVNFNNQKIKERESELLVLKEKQKVYEHFYNTLFITFSHNKKNKHTLSKDAVNELMLFKQGLMNWGSESLIENYIKYDNELVKEKESYIKINEADEFLKEIRKELGFKDSKELSLMSIILNSEGRKELTNYNKLNI